MAIELNEEIVLIGAATMIVGGQLYKLIKLWIFYELMAKKKIGFGRTLFWA